MRDFKEPYYEGKQCKCCSPREAQPASFANLAFDTGVIAERERIVKVILAEAYAVSSPMMVDKEFLDGLERAIELIVGEKK